MSFVTFINDLCAQKWNLLLFFIVILYRAVPLVEFIICFSSLLLTGL